MAALTMSGASVPRVAAEIGVDGALTFTMSQISLAMFVSPEDSLAWALRVCQAHGWTCTPPAPIPQDSTTLDEAQVQAVLADPTHPNAAALAWVEQWYATPPGEERQERHICDPTCPDWQEGVPDAPSTGTVASSTPGVEAGASGTSKGKEAATSTEIPAYRAEHYYPDEDGTSDCQFGCGCWMGPSRSGGPDGVDPFGHCPAAPAPTPPPRTTGLHGPLTFAEHLGLTPKARALVQGTEVPPFPPAVPRAQRFTPCGNRPCVHLGSHHSGTTGACTLAGCVCRAYTPDMAFLSATNTVMEPETMPPEYAKHLLQPVEAVALTPDAAFLPQERPHDL